MYLGLVKPDPGINALSVLGVSFLFFIAGLQIKLDDIKGKPLYLRFYGLDFIINYCINPWRHITVKLTL